MEEYNLLLTRFELKILKVHILRQLDVSTKEIKTLERRTKKMEAGPHTIDTTRVIMELHKKIMLTKDVMEMDENIFNKIEEIGKTFNLDLTLKS